MVEAGWRSGSLNTAGHANDLGRPVGTVPGPVTSAASAGCHKIIREGFAQLVSTADEMAALVTGGIPDEPEPVPRENTRLLDALSTRSPRTVDDIAVRSGLSVAQTQSELGRLELDGTVREGERGWTKRGARRET